MRNSIENYKPEVVNNDKIRSLINFNSDQAIVNDSRATLEKFASEGREELINYIESVGCSKDSSMVILSSFHHYYYDAEEMKNVNTVVNLKEINQIKHIKKFLHSIFHILPQRSNFIGCFVDHEKVRSIDMVDNLSVYQREKNNVEIENGISSRNPFLNMVYNLMDSKTNKYMSKSSVALLLEGHGFKVRNMKEINGLTYFCAQKVGNAVN
jgi:hypothetical protein